MPLVSVSFHQSCPSFDGMRSIDNTSRQVFLSKKIFPLIFIATIRQIFCLSPLLLMRIWCQFFLRKYRLIYSFLAQRGYFFPREPLDQLKTPALTECKLKQFWWAFRAGVLSPLACLPLARPFFFAPTTFKRLLRRLDLQMRIQRKELSLNFYINCWELPC